MLTQFSSAGIQFKCVLDLLNETIVNTNDKAVVVSQFTTVLNMFGAVLHGEGIKYCKLTGSVLVKDRNDIVVEFNKPSSRVKVSVFNMSVL